MGSGTLYVPTLARSPEQYDGRDSEPIRFSLGLQIKLLLRKKTNVPQNGLFGLIFTFYAQSVCARHEKQASLNMFRIYCMFWISPPQTKQKWLLQAKVLEKISAAADTVAEWRVYRGHSIKEPKHAKAKRSHVHRARISLSTMTQQPLNLFNTQRLQAESLLCGSREPSRAKYLLCCSDDPQSSSQLRHHRPAWVQDSCSTISNTDHWYNRDQRLRLIMRL